VAIEGPYRRLHGGVRTRRKVTLLAGGIGVTPLRALLEGLEQGPGDVVVVHRASDHDRLVLSGELAALAQERGARYVTVAGPRIEGRVSWLPQAAAHLTDGQALAQLVPDVAERDVFLCGAPAWMDAARDAALDCHVPAEQIHLERFTY
jgi:ferredoxin-NADP reductase